MEVSNFPLENLKSDFKFFTSIPGEKCLTTALTSSPIYTLQKVVKKKPVFSITFFTNDHSEKEDKNCLKKVKPGFKFSTTFL
jgi:hypothetical protein